MLRECTRYDLESGRLLGVGFVDTDLAPPTGMGRLLGRYDPELEFFNTIESTVIPRTESGAVIDQGTITLGGSVTISNLPTPCELLVSSGTGYVTVEDGVLVLTPQSIGQYFAILDHPHYLRTRFDFEVNP